MYFEMLKVNGGWHVKFSMPDKIKIKNRDETEMYESMFPFFILVCKNDYICRKQNDFDYGDAIEFKKSYSCSKYKETGCGFPIWKEHSGATIMEGKVVKLLLEKGETADNIKM
jgi:hypothetical protein